jgi:hypothetical protein
MKTIKTYNGQPILEVVKGISAGKEVDFGVTRDRQPDNGWGQMHKVNLELSAEKIKETKITEHIKIKLLGDLAYAYGRNTNKFEQKLKEFEL